MMQSQRLRKRISAPVAALQSSVRAKAGDRTQRIYPTAGIAERLDGTGLGRRRGNRRGQSRTRARRSKPSKYSLDTLINLGNNTGVHVGVHVDTGAEPITPSVRFQCEQVLRSTCSRHRSLYSAVGLAGWNRHAVPHSPT